MTDEEYAKAQRDLSRAVAKDLYVNFGIETRHRIRGEDKNYGQYGTPYVPQKATPVTAEFSAQEEYDQNVKKYGRAKANELLARITVPGSRRPL